MASSDKELEDQLFEAGNKLLDPPLSVDELLPLLDQVESCLSRVEQSPSKSMQSALSPSLKALIADNLLKHSDADVKAAVASCISEITRITAPDAPYDDDQMKEVFQLIVSSFENLSDKSSRSYAKRTSILETVAKVRSCVVMLDLECDALILEMFQHFFKAIREHHPENVFTSMETIMTLVIEESEEISIALLYPVLASVKKDNEDVLPIARKLGERVLESCANKFKPSIVQAVKTLRISLDDYSEVLASICQEIPGSLDQSDACATSELAADEAKLSEAPLEESTQVVNEAAREAASTQVNTVGDESPKSVMSNGIVQAEEDESQADTKSLKKQEGADPPDHSRANPEPDNWDSEKVDSTVQKPEQATKRKGRKHSSSVKSTDPSESPAVTNEKETEKLPDSKSQSKDDPISARVDHSVEAAGPSENDDNPKISSPKAVDDESKAAASPSPSEGSPDENRSKKSARSKKKDSLAKEVEMPAEDVSKRVSEGASDSEAKPNRQSAKKAPVTSDSEAKKQLTKKVDGSNKKGDRSSSKKAEEKKKRGRGKDTSETAAGKSSAKDEDKEMVSSPKSGTELNKEKQLEETPKTNLKRKHTAGNDDSDIKEYGENLVGLRVKVWWPKDRLFYKGVIDAYDSVKKKHKVSYDDGDEEILNLKREKWHSIRDDSDLDVEEESDRAKPEASDTPPKKKAKTSAGDSTKQGKMDASSKSDGATSSKSKGTAKDGSKSKDSKTVGKLEDKVNKKSKDHTPKSGSNKSVEKMSSKSKNTETPKLSKSKDEDVGTPKGLAKSKQESKSKDEDVGTPKGLAKSKQESKSKDEDVSKPKGSARSKQESKTKDEDVSKPKGSAKSKQESKSKDEDVSTPKGSAKSKQETSRMGKSKQETSSVAASKGKKTKSGGRSNINDTGKVKSGSLKTKVTENENSEDSTKAVEDTKGKTPNSSKALGSEAKSGKKRRRTQK